MPQAPRQHLDLKTVGDVAVVAFLDAPNVFGHQDVQEICGQLSAVIEDEGRTKLLINLDRVNYLSSAMLGELINLEKKLGRVEGKLKLCRISPALRNIFRVTKIERMFAIYETEQEALDSF